MSSTDHISRENQSLKTYCDVQITLITAFQDWVKATQPPGLTADEGDWDDSYNWWLDNIELNMNPSPMTFLEYVESVS